MPLASIENLRLEFHAHGTAVSALDGVDLSIDPGEAVALVGESGSGKSLTALSLARLLPSPPAVITSGSVVVDGQDVLRLSGEALRRLRGRVVAYVFQEPATALNPVHRVGDQVREALALHRPVPDPEREVVRLLAEVGIASPEARARQHPHELSGGMQQRVMIAMALASHPRLLVADEPTTALDVTVQAQVIDLLDRRRREHGMAVLLITHNLGLVRGFADRVVVMYAGQVVEAGTADQVLGRPRHPYTQALLAAVPRLGAGHGRLAAIPGNAPPPGDWPAGCRFHPRCPVRRPECATLLPALSAAPGRHPVRCPFA